MQVEDDQVVHERDQDEFLVQHRQAWDLDIGEKHRLAKMLESKETFAQQIISRRQEQFEALRVSHPRPTHCQ